MTIVEFLRARLDEDEAAARFASLAPESVNRWVCITPRYPPSAVQIDAPVRSRDVAEVPRSGPARHIVRHDPARVLREVEAKRAIIEEHAARVTPTDVVCQRCVYSNSFPTPHRVDGYPLLAPCRTLSLLALPYSDHPDYDPVWRL